MIRNNKAGVPLLHRWKVMSLPFGRSLFIHKFAQSDDHEPHVHSNGFFSVGFRGQYIDRALIDGVEVDKVYKAPWIRRAPNGHVHRTMLIDGKPCWTFMVKKRTYVDSVEPGYRYG